METCKILFTIPLIAGDSAACRRLLACAEIETYEITFFTDSNIAARLVVFDADYNFWQSEVLGSLLIIFKYRKGESEMHSEKVGIERIAELIAELRAGNFQFGIATIPNNENEMLCTLRLVKDATNLENFLLIVVKYKVPVPENKPV